MADAGMKGKSEILSLKEAAAVLMVEPKTLYSLIYSGHGPSYIRYGHGRYIFERAVVEAFAAAHKTTSDGNSNHTTREIK